MLSIYILQLIYGKYYVGKTNNVKQRIDQHFDNEGAEWTKKYKPLNVIAVIPNFRDEDEKYYTFFFMNKYGINNVRGAGYTLSNHYNDKRVSNIKIKMLNYLKNTEPKLKLNLDYKFKIETEMDDSDDRCFRCGRIGHYVINCYASKHLNGFYLKKK